MHHSSSLPILKKNCYPSQLSLNQNHNYIKNAQKLTPSIKYSKAHQPSVMKQLLVDDSQIDRKSQNILDNYLWKNKIQFNPNFQYLKKEQNILNQNKKDHIKDLLKEQFVNYQSQLLSKANFQMQDKYDDKIFRNDSVKSSSNSLSNSNKFHGKINNSQIDQLYKKSAHQDLELRRLKQKEFKQLKKIQDQEYSKQIQNKILKTLEKGKKFRQYFNDVHTYLGINVEQFKSNTEPILNKKSRQENQFVQKTLGINQDLNENIQKSYQRIQKTRQQKILLLEDLKKQIQYKQKLKNLEKIGRYDYNNQFVVKDIRQILNNPESIEVNNPEISNVFHRRYVKSLNK